MSYMVPPPPPPPPRPHRQTSGHARSSSLDLSRLGGSRTTSFLSEHQSQQHQQQQQYQQQRHHNSLSNCYAGKAPAPLPPLPSHPVSPPPAHSVSPIINLSDQSSHGAFTVFRKRTNTGTGVLPPPPKPAASPSSATASTRLDDLVSSLRSTYSIPHETFIPA